MTEPQISEIVDEPALPSADLAESWDRRLLAELEERKAAGKLDPWSVSMLIELRAKYPTEGAE